MKGLYDQQWCCKICKGKNIQVQGWVCMNTLEFVEESMGCENAIWCEDCQDHTEAEEIPPQLQLDFESDKKCP